jgi:hypothetical protein
VTADAVFNEEMYFHFIGKVFLYSFFEFIFDCTCALVDQSRNAGMYIRRALFIVSAQVMAEQSFHSVFLAAYYPELVFDCVGLQHFNHRLS